MKWERNSLITDKDLDLFNEYHTKKQSDWYNNQFHLSGYCGSINDPNGLVFFDSKYFIFMQNCPFSIYHYNKSWALYTTKDFINYQYEGITLTPSNDYDKHGVFSGSARVNDKGEMEIYYTGNIEFNDVERTSYTLRALIDLKEKLVSKELLFECDLKKYTGHFRDPVVFEKHNKLFMINGAQTIDKKGVLAVHEFVDNKWEFKNQVELDKNFEQNSYMVECPNYFKIDESEFVFACFEQDASLKDGSHFVQYRKVDFQENGSFSFLSDLRKIDLGFDFYAPQVFSNTADRKIMLGWLGNSRSNPFPKELTTWSNNLTVPRKLSEVNNNLYQYPIEEMNNLRTSEINSKSGLFNYENGTVELLADNIANKDFEIKIKSDNKQIIISNKNKQFIVDRSKMDYNDEVELPSVINFEDLKINSLRILIDRSCMEIFINNGEHAISVRTFIINHKVVESDLKESQVYQLKGYNIEWNNTLFKNVTNKK
ncbi:sucrose-6-phosphate hydrolase [Spiroplasma helicoides]|uniref:beta-fructofuranosidase n=1 Tax=Spiroplasma helicoides TaxID=216938 RepID=A0A1B3SKG4_9MOLU|nr:glycoside hydrolase family 32 protein [Spiroplasma helicoides]AOG60417.1 sucrose-6-phosphate hydrolase [Spiroplasma helicoides]